MKLFVWMIQKIFRMLNQIAVDIPTLPVNLCLSHLIQFLVEWCAVLWSAEPQRRAAKHLGHTWFFGKRFCKSSRVFFSTLSAGIESMEFIDRRAAPFVHSGEKRKARTRSRSEMPVWTVSQKFSHLQWRRLIKELWSRPTTTADFGSSFRLIPYTSHVCLLEDKIQDWDMYLFTISTEAMLWMKQVEMVDSVDVFKSSSSTSTSWRPWRACALRLKEYGLSWRDLLPHRRRSCSTIQKFPTKPTKSKPRSW